MVDASYSRQNKQEDRAVVRVRRLRVLAMALAVILIGLGCALLWGFGGRSVAALTPSASAVPVPAREQVSDEIHETAKGLQVTQQQAVDQLQVVQDLVRCPEGGDEEVVRTDRGCDREAS
jgi:hypothetical protein